MVWTCADERISIGGSLRWSYTTEGKEEDQRGYLRGERGHGDNWFEHRRRRARGEMEEDDLPWRLLEKGQVKPK